MELDCRRCDEGIVEFLYGELDDGNAAAFEQHLRQCPRCAAALEQMRQTRETFAQLVMAEPPALRDDDPILEAARAAAGTMAARRQQAAASEAGAGSFWDRLLGVFGGAALRPALGTAVVLVLVVGIGLLFFADRPRHDGPAPSATEELTPIPASELRTQAPEEVAPPPPEPPAPPTPAPVPDEQVVAPPPPTPEPPAPAKVARPPRLSRAPGQPRERAAAETVAREAEAGRAAPALDRAGETVAEQAPPLVVEAQRVQAQAPAPPPVPSTAARSSGGGIDTAPTAPIIPTPPLPRPAAQMGQRYSLDSDQAATPASPSPAGAPAQAPARVAVPAAQSEYDRGMQSFRSGNYQDAADELDMFVRSPSSPASLIPSGIHHLALSQRRLGNLSAAARSYDRLLRQYPSYPRRAQALLEAAEVQGRLGNRAQAEALLRQLSAVPGWSERARAEMARLQHRGIGVDGPLGPDTADEAADEAAETAMPAAAPPAEAAPSGNAY